jgi:arsenate reductase (glutaredoxin)
LTKAGSKTDPRRAAQFRRLLSGTEGVYPGKRASQRPPLDDPDESCLGWRDEISNIDAWEARMTTPPKADADKAVTIFHNPNCGASRNVLAAIRARGIEPTVVEYLKAGWTKPQLKGLLMAMGAKPRDILRVRGTPAEELGLTDPVASDDAILDAMVAHPILVERPIVSTAKAAGLCRPAERVEDLL